MEFKGEVWIEDINLEIVSILMVFNMFVWKYLGNEWRWGRGLKIEIWGLILKVSKRDWEGVFCKVER